MLNKLLLRQVGKYLGGVENIPADLLQLFTVIGESYDHYEKDRKMLERSIELTSNEMLELNNKLRKEAEESNRAVYEKLQESLGLLNEERNEAFSNSYDYLRLEHVADLLKEETAKRKEAERERMQREAHLKASQRIAHVGSWELDLSSLDDINGNALFWSEETYRIFGYEPYSIVPSNALFFERVHPDDREAIAQAMRKTLETGVLYDIEHRIVLPDGTEKMVHERSEVTYDPKTGKPVRMIGAVQDITKRRNADEKLRKANKELRTLFENMQEVFYSVDVENRQVLQITAPCEKIYGYTPQEFYDNPDLWLDVILDEDKPIIYESNVAVEKGLSVKQEFRIHRKDGSIRWLESKLEPTLKDGKLIRLDGVTSDITQRKEAELSLKDSEYKFRSLIEHSSDAIIVVDENMEITYASDSLYRVTGYRPEDIVGLPTLSLAHPDEKDMITAFLQEVLRSPGIPKTLLYKTRKKDGSYIWCERITNNLLHDPAIRGIVSNFRDVSERIEYEETLRRSEHKFRSLIEHSADVIAVLDQELRAVYVSDSLYKVTGYRPEEVVGHRSIEYSYEEDHAFSHAWMKEVLKSPAEPKHCIYRIRKKDGAVIWTERVAVNLLHDPAVTGIVLNFRDVTERVEYEQALKTSNEELKKTNSELDKFVYSVSHDLRAPLASVLGVIDLIEMDTGDENVLANLSLMKESIEKLDLFIQDILDYSRNARAEIENGKIDFHQLLDRIIGNLKYMSEARNVALNMSVSNGIDFYSDEGRISIVLNNLISNAIRYHDPNTPQPFVNIHVKLSEEEACISVKDNGTGIKHENQDKIFRMFFRESKKSTGSGLGLYIVKEAVDKLRGRISLISAPGQGSEFQICIPNNNRTQ